MVGTITVTGVNGKTLSVAFEEVKPSITDEYFALLVRESHYALDDDTERIVSTPQKLYQGNINHVENGRSDDANGNQNLRTADYTTDREDSFVELPHGQLAASGTF